MQTKTVTAAAKALHVSQPVISRSIKDLEENIGFSLFIRERGRLKPTVEAKLLYEEVSRSLVGIDRILQSVEMLRDGHQGYLQIAAAPALSLSFMPTVLADFSRQYPGARVSLQMLGSDIALDMVLNGMCDIAVVMLSLREAGAYGQRILSGRMVCAIPKTHALATKSIIKPIDLSDENFISHPHTLDTRLRIDSVFASHGVHRNMKLESQISLTLIGLVAAGAGITLVDPLTATLYKGTDVAFVPFDPIIVIHYSVVVSATRNPSVLQEKFIKHMKEQLNQAIAPEYRVVA